MYRHGSSDLGSYAEKRSQRADGIRAWHGKAFDPNSSGYDTGLYCPGREADTDLFCLLMKALKPSRVLAPRRMGYDEVSGISLFV
jgi:hypothetical protein